MDIVSRVKSLASKRGLTIAQLEKEVGLSPNSLYRWNKNKPSLDKLENVADYFNISADYLLGRIDDPNITSEDMDAAELINSMLEGDDNVVKLMKKISSLGEDDYKTVENLVDFLLSKNKETQD